MPPINGFYLIAFKPKRCHSFSCLQFLQDLQLLICGLKGRIAYASNVFVYTKTLFALQNACWGVPQTPLICIFQCRLRIPSGRFLSGDVLRVVEDLYEVRSGFCQRSILHLFRDRRIQKRNAPFLHTEKANLNKLRGMQHRKVAHRAYRR